MTVTAIEAVGHGKNKIYIDGEYAFMLYDRDLLTYGLPDVSGHTRQMAEGLSDVSGHTRQMSEGLSDSSEIMRPAPELLLNEAEISQQLYDRIIAETVLPRALQKATALLERADQTEAELRRKLRQNLYPDSVIDIVLEYTDSHRYTDDTRYAESYVRLHILSLSRRDITMRLLKKGISKEDIDAAFDTYMEEQEDLQRLKSMSDSRQAGRQDGLSGAAGQQYGQCCEFGPDTDAETPGQTAALNTLRKKLCGRSTVDAATRTKLMAALYRKGFERSDILYAMSKLGLEGEDDI